jgi:hypothetical protein
MPARVGGRSRETAFQLPEPLPVSESNAIRFYDPKFAGRWPVSERQGEPLHERENGSFVVNSGPKNNDSGVFARQVGPDVGKI